MNIIILVIKNCFVSYLKYSASDTGLYLHLQVVPRSTSVDRAQLSMYRL
jgi:hypothetical protein